MRDSSAEAGRVLLAADTFASRLRLYDGCVAEGWPHDEALAFALSWWK